MDSMLPFDLKMEVFSRASLKTLDTLRCTSREIEKLTYDSYFLNLYKQRNTIVWGFLVQNMKRGWEYIKEFAPSPESVGLDLGFLPFNARILATCEQGIVVFESRDPKGSTKDLYHVCKPATKQVLPLPNPKTKYTTENIAIVVVGSKPLHYKIVRLSKPKCSVLQRRGGELYSTYRFEIFDSTTWKWRLLDLVMLPYGVFLTCPQPITTSGSIYMLLTNNEVLKIDANSEKWTVFPSPISMSLEDQYSDTSKQLVKYEGKLGFACKSANGGWEIWVLNIEGLWEKIYVCNKKEDTDERKSALKGFYDSETSIMMDGDTLVFNRFKEGYDIIKVVLHDTPYQIFDIRSDFEPIDLSHI